MTHPNWFADDAETTGTIPAAPAVDPVESPTAKLRAVATARQSTLLPAGEPPVMLKVDGELTAAQAHAISAALTAGPGPLPAELSNPAMEPVHIDADDTPLGYLISELDPDELFHVGFCGCPDIDNPDPVVHQGYDFRELGAAYRAKIREQVVAEDTARFNAAVADVPHVVLPRHAAPAERFPVEAKVSAGAGGALAASLALAAVTLLLQQLDAIPALIGGDRPWVGVLVLLLGVLLPPVASFLSGYAAPHSPRCEP